MDSHIDSLSFPPGLIPQLASSSQRNAQQQHHHTTIALPSSSSYIPLSVAGLKTAKIHPPPPPDQRDPYLEARLNKFYVHLDAYKPGMQYSDLQNTISNSDGWNNNSDKSTVENPATTTTTTTYQGYKPTSSSLNDGRYKGPRGKASQSTGLGYRSSSSVAHEGDSGSQDPYDAYRAMRKAMTYKD